MTIRIMQTNPRAQYLAQKEEIDTAILKTLDKGWYILGQEVSAFEQEFADFLNVKHVVGVANGTDAIQVALRACGVGLGDAVFTVSHTAVATVAAVELTGASPVLVDVDEQTYTMDPNRLEWAIDRLPASTGLKPKAIVAVHLYGHPADMGSIMAIAQKRGLYVIEDCAQSHGAMLDGRTTGGIGHLSAFSFYPTKNLGAIGDGGAVATNDPVLYGKVQLLRQYGWKERFISEVAGMNSRLDELQAAILRIKLKRIADDNRLRGELALIYRDVLQKINIGIPHVHPTASHVYHQFVVRTPKRDDLRSCLYDHGVGTAIHYPRPVHKQPAYEGRVIVGAGGLTTSERICPEILSLPMYPQLSRQDVREVAEAIVSWSDQS